ncbi:MULTISPECIES: HAD hydrolase family protein [unclassified Mesorhizobium]|uniref:HAD hydrolase family protein n=1 Tax=unclassified Mesorhizobium TaxID=325217 RepID=UPI001FE1121D|nr:MULTISPECIES: HAD hydrolase family protein [unclassified Mesorhizobium]
MVAKTLGVPAERCAAAGDAANDLSLLRWAKVRLTVANAIAPIRDMGTLLWRHLR